MTELVTNALEYGTGNISAYFYQKPDRQAVLIVEDKGTLAPEFNLDLSAGFGVPLIQKLIARRGGLLMVDGMANHTRFIAVTPHPKNEIHTAKVGKPISVI